MVQGVPIPSKTADRPHSTFSLDNGAIGYKPGNVSIANTTSFFLNSKDNETPDILSEEFVSHLYTDISISYAETTPQNPSHLEECQLEDISVPDGWRYNVRLVKY